MTTNEIKILKIVWDWGGEASINIVAKEAGISLDYARVLCQSLNKENNINFLNSRLCKLKNKGELVIAKSKSQLPRIIIPGSNNKKERLTINYG